jgi:hypothetical protein
MQADDPKRAILARRKRLVAAALAGVGACTGLQACPQACLEPALPELDAGRDGDAARDAGADSDGG